MWKALHAAFTHWSTELTTLAAPHASRDPDVWRLAPVYDTAAWWACMTVRRLDNLQLVSAKHTEHALRPDTVDGLPVAEDDDQEAKCALSQQF